MRQFEVPVDPETVRALRSVVPRPRSAASSVGGPYYVRPCHADVEPLLQRRLAVVVRAFVDCGWVADANETRVVRYRDDRALRLVWPWEWTHAASSNACATHCTNGSCQRAVALLPHWQCVAFETLVHASGPVHVFGAAAPRQLNHALPTDDLVSSVTDAERHQTFATLRRPAVQICDATGNEARFLCHAARATSTKGGVVRHFVPADGAGDDLVGFVSTDPTTLLTGLGVARNIVHCERPSSCDDAHTDCHDPLLGFLFGMSEHAVGTELGLDAPLRLGGAELMEHGLLPSVSRACWPYRLAFARRLAMACARDVRYLEVAGTNGGLSKEMIVCDAHGGVARQARCMEGGVVLLAWDGKAWALRKR